MDKRKIRDFLRLINAVLFSWLYIPHLLVANVLLAGGGKMLVYSDVSALQSQLNINLQSKPLLLLYFLHNNRYYRNVFYHRIGPVLSMIIGWYRPGDRYLSISKTTKIGKGVIFAHPYSSILNADKIGDSFNFRHGITIGSTPKGRPVIGNNVTLGANVTIIGNVKIGDNVIIGAGAVVVKDIPDNCIAAGNPAKIIRYIQNAETFHRGQ